MAKYKDKNISVEADVEKVLNNVIDKHFSEEGRKTFRERQIEKRKNKEQKHLQKMEIIEKKANKKTWLGKRTEEKLKIERQQEEIIQLKIQEQKREKVKAKYKILSIIGAVLCGLFCIVCFEQHKYFAAAVCLIQVTLYTTSYFLIMNDDKNEKDKLYKTLFTISCLLALVFIAVMDIVFY